MGRTDFLRSRRNNDKPEMVVNRQGYILNNGKNVENAGPNRD